MSTVSALVVVHNEQAQLADCLTTLKFADEIVVVLDKCTDKSKKIAKRFNAKLVEGHWELEGPRRNIGINACTSDWVFEIDADERAPQSLGEEIKHHINAARADYCKIPVDNYIGARLVKHGWGGSFGKPKYIGLFRKGVKRWGDERVHPRLELNGVQGSDLKNSIIHYVDESISDTIQRLNNYAEKRALDLVDKGNIGTLPNNIRRFFSRFLRCYIGRGGFREGGYGLVIAVCAGLFPVLSYIKAKEIIGGK